MSEALNYLGTVLALSISFYWALSMPMPGDDDAA